SVVPPLGRIPNPFQQAPTGTPTPTPVVEPPTGSKPVVDIGKLALEAAAAELAAAKAAAERTAVQGATTIGGAVVEGGSLALGLVFLFGRVAIKDQPEPKPFEAQGTGETQAVQRKEPLYTPGPATPPAVLPGQSKVVVTTPGLPPIP